MSNLSSSYAQKFLYEAKYEQAIQDLITFAYPNTTRGPANPDWVIAMKQAADILEWARCDKCDGFGDCTRCLNVGYIKE